MNVPPASTNTFPQNFGKYELVNRLNRGGMAELFLARPSQAKASDPSLVIKRILPHMAQQPRFQEMFVSEAHLAAEVRHPNVVKIYELGRVGDELYIAMEYVQGHDLRILLRESVRRRLRIPPWFAVYVVTQVLHALDCVWAQPDHFGNPRHIVHGDVTPSNILLSHQGDVKLVDFGVARDKSPVSDHRPSSLGGKLAYLAPEQYQGLVPDQRTDIFSVGVVLWELLAQQRLFGGQPKDEIVWSVTHEPRPTPSALMADIPLELDEIILKSLAIEREQRIPSAKDFIQQLQALRFNNSGSSTDIRAVIQGLTKPTGKGVESLLGNLDEVSLVPRAKLDAVSGSEARTMHFESSATTIGSWNTHATNISPNFWLKGPRHPKLNPLEAHDLLNEIRQLRKDLKNPLELTYISIDRERWSPLSAFLQSAGMSLLDASPPIELIESPSWKATASDHSLLAILTTLTRTRASGRLYIEAEQETSPGYWILHIRRGQPMLLSASALEQQIPYLLVKHRVCTKDIIPWLFHDILTYQSSLADALSRRINVTLGGLRPTLMKLRLSTLLNAPLKRFAFDTRLEDTTQPPFASTLLAPFIQLIDETIAPAQVRARVQPFLEQPCVPARDYHNMVQTLELPKYLQQTATELGQERPIRTVLATAPRTQIRAQYALIYMLIESELLKPMRSATFTSPQRELN